MTAVKVVAEASLPEGVPTIARRRPPGILWFAGRAVLRFVISIAVLIVATFAMIHLIPGDPVKAALGDEASPEAVEARRHQLGLDLPLVVQFFRYVGGLLHGDLGVSITSLEPVSRIIGQRLPNSLSLALPAFAIIMVISVVLGTTVAIRTWRRPARVIDSAFTGVTSVLNSIPDFALATGLVALFSVSLGMLPVAGRSGPLSYVLPIASLAIGSVATLARITRVETDRILRSDYIRAAVGRRVRPWSLYCRHVLPNMLTATLTYGGLLLSSMVAGTVIVENVFAWPGIGTKITEAVIGKDYALVQGIVLVIGTLVLLINFAVDLLLLFIDPRQRTKALS